MSNSLLGIPEIDPVFDHWWARNHPWDWWASERHGDPIPTFDRLLVAQLVREAYDAGKRCNRSDGDGK